MHQFQVYPALSSEVQTGQLWAIAKAKIKLFSCFSSLCSHAQNGQQKLWDCIKMHDRWVPSVRQSKAILMMDTNLVCPTSCKNLGPQILPKDIGGESLATRDYMSNQLHESGGSNLATRPSMICLEYLSLSSWVCSTPWLVSFSDPPSKGLGTRLLPG